MESDKPRNNNNNRPRTAGGRGGGGRGRGPNPNAPPPHTQPVSVTPNIIPIPVGAPVASVERPATAGGRGRGQKRERSTNNANAAPERGPQGGRGGAGAGGAPPHAHTHAHTHEAHKKPKGPREPIHHVKAGIENADLPPIPMTGFLTEARFADLALSPPLQRAMREVFGYESMSEIQRLTIPSALQGRDVFGKAKTGSGKTLGFLLPALQRLEQSRSTPGRLSVLVLSPTRELAEQSRREAEKLLTFADGRGVQSVIGGTNINREKKELASLPCDVLVATPGRLLDHLSEKSFAAKFANIQCVVLDEADRLLDMGFQPDIKRILNYLPPKDKRQTLLFTATVPAGVREIGEAFLRPDSEYVDAVHEDESESHAHIDHRFQILPRGDVINALACVIDARHKTEKMIVFFTTARMAQFAAALFRKAGYPNVLEVHSRLSQSQRTNNLAKFTKDANGLLFASDAIARGIDLPDVSLVIQVGHTDATQYTHRVGRTGRAGREGEGLWLIADDEARVVKEVEKTVALQPYAPAFRCPVPAPAAFATAVSRLMKDGGETKSLGDRAFVATLGFYATYMKRFGWSVNDCVQFTKERLGSMGLTEAPAIEAKILGKMNLKGAQGLVIAKPGGNGGGGGGGGNRPRAPSGERSRPESAAPGGGQGQGGRGGGGRGGGRGGRGGGRGGY